MRKWLIPIFLVVALACGCGPDTRAVEEDVRRGIEQVTPVGSSKTKVLDYLDDNFFEVVAQPDWLDAPGFEDAEWMTATTERRNRFGRFYVKVDLYFDKATSNLSGFEVSTHVPR